MLFARFVNETQHTSIMDLPMRFRRGLRTLKWTSGGGNTGQDEMKAVDPIFRSVSRETRPLFLHIAHAVFDATPPVVLFIMEIFFPSRCCKRVGDASWSCNSWARLSSWLPCGLTARWSRAAKYRRRAKPCICKEGVISPRPSSYVRCDFIIKTMLMVSSMVSLRVHRRPMISNPDMLY